MKNTTIIVIMAAAILIAGCGKKSSSSSAKPPPPRVGVEGVESSSSPVSQPEQKEVVAASPVIVYASANTNDLSNISLVVQEIWKGSDEASTFGITNGMQLSLQWLAKYGLPPDGAVVCFPQGVSSSTASGNWTEYPVSGGKVSGMSIQQFKSKYGL